MLILPVLTPVAERKGLEDLENIHIVTGRGTLRMREQVLDFLQSWCDPPFTPAMLDTSHIAVSG